MEEAEVTHMLALEWSCPGSVTWLHDSCVQPLGRSVSAHSSDVLALQIKGSGLKYSASLLFPPFPRPTPPYPGGYDNSRIQGPHGQEDLKPEYPAAVINKM